MYHLHFGLAFNDAGYIGPKKTAAGTLLLGPRGIRDLLEQYLGVIPPNDRLVFMRLLAYRLALLQVVEEQTDTFYKRSFEQDPLATAERLLAERDALIGGGWDFEATSSLPERLLTLAFAEKYYLQQGPPLGFEDRIERIIQALRPSHLPDSQLFLYDNIEHLSPVLQRLVAALAALRGLTLHRFQPDTSQSDGTSDLAVFQRFLLQGANGNTSKAQNDGSIKILKARTEHEAAQWFSAELVGNGMPRAAVCLATSSHVALDKELIINGLPAMGSRSSSMARPWLQLLYLAGTFIWEPLDPVRVLQFLQLPYDPIHFWVRAALSEVSTRKPGIGGAAWQNTLTEVLSRLLHAHPTQVGPTQDAISFWFEQPLHSPATGAPVAQLVAIFEHLAAFGRTSSKRGAQQMGQQAEQIALLLPVIGQDRISQLLLNQVLQTALEPVALHTQQAEAYHLDFVFVPTAIGAPIDEVWWWNCLEDSTLPKISLWYPQEQLALKSLGVLLPDTSEQGSIQLRNQHQAVLMARKKLLLVLPETRGGESVMPHPIFQYLAQCFGDSCIQFEYQALQNLQQQVHLTPRIYSAIEGTINADASQFLLPPHQSPSALNKYLDYPHQYALDKLAKLRREEIPSAADHNKLLGNLAHTQLEQLFNRSDFLELPQNELSDIVNRELDILVRTEGAVLYQFGRENDKQRLFKYVKQAAISLQRHLIEGHWSIYATEMSLEGHLADGTPLVGKADLVLQRGNEWGVIDLKWSGSKNYYFDLLKNRRDLQLMLYAHMLGGHNWAHTGYFLISQDILLSRNRLGFPAAAISSNREDNDHIAVYNIMWEAMRLSLQWRKSQLEGGQVEVRIDETLAVLDALYQDQDLLGLLEPPAKTDRFDPYLAFLGVQK